MGRRVRYRILGTLRVVRGDEVVELGGPRQQLVLAVLLLHVGRSVPLDHVIDAVWGRHPPSSARKTVQAYVSRLRRVGGDGMIETTTTGYRLVAEPEDVDAVRFERLVRTARDHLPDDPAPASDLLDEALALWRGAPWGALGQERALAPDAARLVELRRGALEDRLEIEVAAGRYGAAISELEGLVAAHPLRERARGLLMLALYRGGRPADALGVYADTRRLVAEELGAEPAPQLQLLHRRMLHQDPDLLVPVDRPVRSAGPGPDVSNPYRGLRSFGVEDAADFFGRARITEELVARLDHEPFVALVGPSGSGKSSVVRAGVLAAVAAGASVGGGDATVALMVPGAHPFEALEAALAPLAAATGVGLQEAFRGDDLDLLRAGLRVCRGERDRLLLVVDQFEELFLHGAGRGEAGRFARNLAEAAEDPHGRTTILVTVRADFVDRPLAHARLGPWLDRGLVGLLPLTPAEVEEACVAPAAALGVPVEPELAAVLVADLTANPGALPQLQFALTELFDQRGSGGLTLAAHERLGGVAGVLGRRAEQEFRSLDGGAQAVARDLFLRLVTPGDAADDTRRRAPRGELEDLAEDPSVAAGILSRFGAARLLTFDRDAATGAATVEVAHEAMLDAWPRLRDWADEARDDVRRQRRLARSAREWEEADRHPDFLLSASRLDQLGDLGGAVSLVAPERAYLDASHAHLDEVAHRDEERRVRERGLRRRATRRTRVALALVAVAAVLGLALGAIVGDRADDARAAQDAQQVAATLDRANELAAGSVAVAPSDPELGLLLALHAADIAHVAGEPVPAESLAALHWALQEHAVGYPDQPGPIVVLDGPDGPRGVFDMPPDELVEVGRSAVARDLTPAECAAWLDQPTCPVLSPSGDGIRSESLVPARDAEAAMPLADTAVSLLAMGDDPGRWLDEVARLRDATDISLEVGFESSRSTFGHRIDRRDVDLAILPGPEEVVARGRAGELVDLSAAVAGGSSGDPPSSYLASLGGQRADGGWPGDGSTVWGLPVHLAVQGGIWFPARAFAEAGYEEPTTWGQLVALVEQIRADGRTPWCHAQAAGLDIGEPGTDWIEDLVLHEFGVQVYDGWVAHEIAFDDPRIRAAFGRYAELLLGPGRILGARHGGVTVRVEDGIQAMVADPPACWLLHAPTSASATVDRLGVEVGPDVDILGLPAIGPPGEDALVGEGGFLVALRDRPEVRHVARWLVGEHFGQELASEDGAWRLRANPGFRLDVYDGEAERAMAAALGTAITRERFRFDGSSLMPPPVREAFQEAMVMFLEEGPDNLDEVLEHVEVAWDEVEAG